MTYDFDIKEFWRENETCLEPFSTNKPRVPISFWLDDHFLLEEMSLPSTVRYFSDFDYRREMNNLCNDKVEKVLAKRFYSEDKIEAPSPVRFEVIMGARWRLTEGGTPWLDSAVENIEDVKKIIDRAVKVDMKKEAFPEGWQESKDRYEKLSGRKLKLGGDGSRGPATMATSILGTTNTCLFIMDEPDIMMEFFSLLADKLVEYHRVLMEDTSNSRDGGYSLADDNCYLFPPNAYLKFCAPVLAKLFKEFAPLPKHCRHQHSDSNMGHLMGILNDLGVNCVNFGPELHPSDIRKAMPKAVIHGQMPPFTLRNGTPVDIINTVRRDIEAVGQDGGLVECPAGSVAGGTPLENLRIYMWAVHTYGRY
ncbi:MAG: uroporphyrinogen decarboxylase family protein [Clostridiaceae bacterium]